jgi:arylsulfatase A
MQSLKLLTTLLLWGYLSTCSAPPPAAAEVPDGPPNIIIIFADDQGYGDVGVYGSTRIHTPNLDRMAMEGLKLTNFYAFPSCSPSRAALLTGAYPPRVGIPDVIGPKGPDWTSNKQYGINAVETTLPEMLKRAGYATGMIGKWHLGHFPETMPLRHGFDQFFGLPYSNDMHPGNNPLWPDLPLLDGEDTVALNRINGSLPVATPNGRSNFLRNTRTPASSCTWPTVCRTCPCSPRRTFRIGVATAPILT